MSSIDRGRAKMVAGFSNHRRIEIVRLLIRSPSLCVNEVAALCRIEQSTAVEHVKRLHEAGLVSKKSKGRKVLLSPTDRAKVFVESMTHSGKFRSDVWTYGNKSIYQTSEFSLWRSVWFGGGKVYCPLIAEVLLGFGVQCQRGH